MEGLLVHDWEDENSEAVSQRNLWTWVGRAVSEQVWQGKKLKFFTDW